MWKHLYYLGLLNAVAEHHYPDGKVHEPMVFLDNLLLLRADEDTCSFTITTSKKSLQTDILRIKMPAMFSLLTDLLLQDINLII